MAQDFNSFCNLMKKSDEKRILNMKKVMKRTFLIVLGCLLCGIMKAQQQQKLFEEFRREAGDHAEMFLGKIERGYPPAIYMNLPYWTFDDFVQGDVLYNGMLYQNVRIRYDAYLKQLVVNTPVKHSKVYIPMSKVEKFVLEGIEFERRDGEFVAILYNSPRMELVERLSITVKERFVENSKVQYEFRHEPEYRVLRDGQMYEVNKLKSVLKLFPDLKKELKQFAKMHYLEFKEHRQSSLISMIKYADELLDKSVN